MYKIFKLFSKHFENIDIQSGNTILYNDNLKLTVNMDNDCSKMVCTADFDISFDTVSCTSVDNPTISKSLTSDSLNETSPSSDTCCVVEGSHTDSCDCPCITRQCVSDKCNYSSNNVKSVTRENVTFEKNVDIVKSSDFCINSSVLPERFTRAYMNNCSHDVQIPATNSLEYASSTDDADTWLLLKGLHIVHLNIHYVLPKLDEIQSVLSQNPNIDCLCMCEPFFRQFCS